jgi:hypothetical protein
MRRTRQSHTLARVALTTCLSAVIHPTYFLHREAMFSMFQALIPALAFGDDAITPRTNRQLRPRDAMPAHAVVASCFP